MSKGSMIAKYIDKEYNKKKYYKNKREKENEIKRKNISTEKIMILGEHARTTLILEKEGKNDGES